MWFHNKVYMYYLLINCFPNRQCYKSSRRRVGHEWPPSLPIGGGLGARIFSLLTGCFPILSLSLCFLLDRASLSLSVSTLSLFISFYWLSQVFFLPRETGQTGPRRVGRPPPTTQAAAFQNIVNQVSKYFLICSSMSLHTMTTINSYAKDTNTTTSLVRPDARFLEFSKKSTAKQKKESGVSVLA